MLILMINLLHGDCLEEMKTLDDNSVDSIVSDPPYGISFMAKKWDYDVPSVEVWREAMRVLKPGGHGLIACGTRTQHRMVVNIEDAGFEIRDVVSWIYGSGFPKSLNISKAIDKAAGAEREVVEIIPDRWAGKGNVLQRSTQAEAESVNITAPATEAAKQWDGWGTALKPACEFFTLARKPLSEKTVAANVLKWGTGAINIDGCRVRADGERLGGGAESKDCKSFKGKDGWDRPFRHDDDAMEKTAQEVREKVKKAENLGRFPANMIHDGSQEVLGLFPETKSGGGDKGNKTVGAQGYGSNSKTYSSGDYKPNQGSAARFFYCPKASKKDRGEGNSHPTVKPTILMQYLCRLITPTGGTVLDPYMGSGSTGKAAALEGFDFVGCEIDPDYYEIAQARIAQASEGRGGK